VALGPRWEKSDRSPADLAWPSPRLRPRPADIDKLAAVWRCASCGRGTLSRQKDPEHGAAALSVGRPGQSLLLVIAGLARRGSRKDIKAHPRVILRPGDVARQMPPGRAVVISGSAAPLPSATDSGRRHYGAAR
jgi:hypothetical protein